DLFILHTQIETVILFGMKSIIFFDTEIDPRNKRVVDFGGIKENESFYHKSSKAGFFKFAKGSQYICGHNIIDHDLKYIGKGFKEAGFDPKNVIDTLYLSPLLFPKKPYHHLVKDEKLQVDELNNPLADSRKARDLFYEEVLAFQGLDVVFQ